MAEEKLDLSGLSGEQRTQLFLEAAHQLLANVGYDPQSFQAELRRKFEASPEPLFFSIHPPTLKVGKLGGKLEEVPLEKFEADEKITWMNSPVLGQEVRAEIFRDTTYPRGFNAAVAEILHQNISNFAICDINETVGKGLVFVASAATPTLPAGTILGLYTGVVSSADTGKGFCAYGYNIPISPIPELPSVFPTIGVHSLFLDAERFRNITSYVQHAPDENALSKIQNLPDEIKACVARANVVAAPTVHCGVDVLLFTTSRDINPGKDETELLFLNYGTYFNGKPYQLFDTHGKVVGTVNENNEFEKNPHYEPEKKPKKIPRGLSEEQIAKLTTQNSHNAQNFLSLYFFEQAKFAISVYQKRAIPGTESILEAFARTFAKIEHAGSAHDAIDNAVTIRNLLDSYPSLLPLKHELICLLKMHNAYLEILVSFRKKLQDNPNTQPVKWGVKKEEWQTCAIEEKNYLGFFGRIKELRAAKKDLSYLSPLITKFGDKDLLAVAVSILFEREAEKKEEQQSHLKLQKK